MTGRFAWLLMLFPLCSCAGEIVVREQSEPIGRQASEWRSLFDGVSPTAWRGFKKADFPERGWVVEAGCLKVEAGGGGGDIITRDQFTDFEFECEWRVQPGGNSGIMYRVTEEGRWPWQTGPEMQVLDNEGHADGKNPKTSAGALYGLLEGDRTVVKPAGEWNRARIRVAKGRVEHWLNGQRVVAYSPADVAFRELVSRSKFAKMPLFARAPRGHICLQDHGDDVWYRHLKIRELAESP